MKACDTDLLGEVLQKARSFRDAQDGAEMFSILSRKSDRDVIGASGRVSC